MCSKEGTNKGARAALSFCPCDVDYIQVVDVAVLKLNQWFLSTCDRGAALVPYILSVATIPSFRLDWVFHEKPELHLRWASHQLRWLRLRQECPVASPLGALFLTVVTHSAQSEIKHSAGEKYCHLITSLHSALRYWLRDERLISEPLQYELGRSQLLCVDPR